MKEHVVYCGIDVAKGQLDGALLGKRWQVPKTKAGIRRLIKMLRQRNACPQVICEASGGYEQELVELLHQAAVPVTLVQPQRVHHLHGPAVSWPKPIRSTRRCWCALAKRSRPRPMQLQWPKHSYCANWIDSALISAASSSQNKIVVHSCAIPRCVNSSAQLIKQIQGHIVRIDARTQAIIAADQELKAKAKMLTSFSRSGPAHRHHALRAQMPELGQLKRREAAA